MINKICWDLDDSLAKIVQEEPNYPHIHFQCGLDLNNHYGLIRPSSYSVINYARNLIGDDNVFLFTKSTKEYAREVNRIAEWGFKEENILARKDYFDFQDEQIRNPEYRHPLANKCNILVDNLPFWSNFTKTSLLGISEDRYLQIVDFTGKRDDPNFEEQVIEFLKEKWQES
jgi:hypothetical protein